ncbi:hypothetical protein [Paraburkholderia hospita]|uniref:hypothetical protein n=1 Tax=Paraburkholderia hospita TaxID=169430 RepID=UPI000B343B30|nr:hypothetical protein [Paraburkholderia hospita]OUL78182.1 hypothetical protein CA603_34895 [Paraburkholderia hospita]
MESDIDPSSTPPTNVNVMAAAVIGLFCFLHMTIVQNGPGLMRNRAQVFPRPSLPTVTIDVGGKTDARCGGPLRFVATIREVSHGSPNSRMHGCNLYLPGTMN